MKLIATSCFNFKNASFFVRRFSSTSLSKIQIIPWYSIPLFLAELRTVLSLLNTQAFSLLAMYKTDLSVSDRDFGNDLNVSAKSQILIDYGLLGCQ